MRIEKISALLFTATIALLAIELSAQTVVENEEYKFKVGGYLRTGFGYSENGDTQASFQAPGALNRYSLGNQPDTYGELEFDYTHYLKGDKSLDLVWMSSIYEPFGSENEMSYNFTEQLYFKANNLFGFGESIWAGKRFYDRKAIYMLDRQWMNPGQQGWGAGVENLLKRGKGEDLKFAAWQLKDRDITSYKNGLEGDLATYTVDARWVNRPISSTTNLNFALNYSYRAENSDLGYEGKGGFGAFAWSDYTKRDISNTTALIFRQGANITIDHWNGMSQKENPNNDNLVMNDLTGAYSVELNNNFLYDDLNNFALNAIFIFVARNYGTSPYYLENGNKEYISGRGDMFYWLSGGARAMYYVSKQFRPTLEYTYEFVHNSQLGVSGSLNRVTFSPEFSLNKGYYSRPVVRPFVTYAFWSDQLKGLVGNTPSGAPYAKATSGFTCGVQFEIWW